MKEENEMDSAKKVSKSEYSFQSYMNEGQGLENLFKREEAVVLALARAVLLKRCSRIRPLFMYLLIGESDFDTLFC